MQPIDRSSSIAFGLNPLDRLSDKRQDATFVEARRRDSTTRFLLLAQHTPILKTIAASDGSVSLDPFFTVQEWEDLAEALGATSSLASESIFLGTTNAEGAGMSVFAIGIDAPPQSIAGTSHAASASGSTSAPAPARPHWRAIDLRTLALEQQMPPVVLGELAGAKSVLHWHSRHRYCANCGTPTAVSTGGWRRDCSACNAQHFPRVDPVVIMLLIDGERCVLGRQPQFAPGMYSALAGFLEPGETMEDAVRREIKEEAGVACSQVTYFASQPWPFPSSLMIACFARATQTTLTIDVTELEDARWFTRAEVATMLQGEHPDALGAPKPYAIAHHLLQHFVRHGAAVLGDKSEFVVE